MTTFTDVACTVCGCVCDDLSLSFEGDRLARVERSCPLADPWFAALNGSLAPLARVRGAACSFDDGIAAAVDLLRRSRAPLIYGLSRSSTPGQREAVWLAEQLGAVIDTTASVCHGPSIMAIQQAGESTCSLGEVRERADLVIFWGADPATSHPRHFERYSVDPVSDLLPRGRRDRTVVVVDAQPSATSAAADLFVRVPPGRNFEAIWTLRELVSESTGRVVKQSGSQAISAGLVELARLMTSCRYGAVFFGLGLAQNRLGHLVVDGLLRLVAELNSRGRFIARRLRIPGDVAGADSVLCWQTGFPFAVDFSRGYPRYNPGEYTADDLLRRGDVDACVLVGSESLAMFSQQSRTALAALPTVVLDYPHVEPLLEGTVQFSTAVYGIHAAGTAYRMDEIPIPLRRLRPSSYPTDEEVLARVRETLTGRTG
jgi:formylmethanofuran dehydrogenase subunit B